MGPSDEQGGTIGAGVLLAKLTGSSTSLAVWEFMTCVLLRPLVGILPLGKGFAAVGWHFSLS